MKKIFLVILFSSLIVSVFSQIRPQQIKKVTGNGKQKLLMSDGTTGIFDYESDGLILPYDTQAAVEGQYDIDALVTFGGAIWRSQANNNVTTPGVGTWSQIGNGSSGGSTTNIAFDGDRSILRVPTTGVNIGTDSIKQWLEWWYFAPPTISSISGIVVEVGTSNSRNFTGLTTNPGGATLSLGSFREISPSSISLDAFGSGTSYSASRTWTPTQAGTGNFNGRTYSYRASQAWVFGSESGTVNSSTVVDVSVFPVFYGVSTTDFTTTGNVYASLTKLVVEEGVVTVTFNGTGNFYVAIPKDWNDFTISNITAPGGLDATDAFTQYDITVSSSGLVNDWSSENYTLIKSNLSGVASGDTYTFTF